MIGVKAPGFSTTSDTEFRPIRASGLFVLALALLVALSPAIWPPNFQASVWVSETAAVLLFFSGLRVLRSPLDLTECIHWMNALMAFMFVLHPYRMISTGKVLTAYHDEYYIAPTYSAACLMGLIGALSLNSAYAFAVRRTTGSQVRIAGYLSSRDIQTQDLQSRVLVTWTKGFTLLGLAAAGLAAVAGGSITMAFSKSEDLSSAYFYLAPLILAPAGCLWYAIGYIDGNNVYKAYGLVIAGTITIITASVGQRTGLVSSVGPILLTMVCLKAKRIPRVIAVILGIISLFCFSALRDVGHGGPAGERAGFYSSITAQSWSSGVLTSLDGADLEMVDGMALERTMIPSVLPFSPAQEIGAVAGAAIPRAWWPDKPLTADNQLNLAFLGRGANQASVAYSIFGEGWYAGGYLGIIVFAGATGAIYGRIRNIYLRSNRGLQTTCLYALTTPLAVVHLRGSLAYTLAYCLFYVGPVIFLIVRSKRRHTAEGQQ